MAITSIWGETTTGASWSIDGLDNSFNTTNYIRVLVSTGFVGDGSSTAPSGILDSVNAPSSGSDTSVSDSFSTGLSPGSSVWVYGYAQAANGLYYNCGYYAAYTLPGNPSNISFTASGLTGSVIFTKGSGATETYIDRDWVSNGSNDYDDYTTGTSFSYTLPYYGHNYSIALFSYSSTAGTTGAWSSVYTCRTRLAQPTVSSSSSTGNSISFSINPVSNTDGNTVYYSIALYLGSTMISENYSSNTSATFNGLSSGTTYTVKWYAHDTATSYPDSTTGQQNVTTQSWPTLTTPTITSITGGMGTISASINSVSNATNYHWQLLQGGVVQESADTGTTTSVTFGSLPASTTYTVKVKAQATTGYGDSAYATSGSASTSAPITLSTPSIQSHVDKYKSITVNLSSVANASSYTVEIETSGGTPVTSGNGASTSITISGLTTNTSYRFRAKAEGVGYYLDSSWSSYTSFTTLANPSPPSFNTGLTVKGSGFIRLYWSEVLYASSYQVQYKTSAGAWTAFTATSSTNQDITGLTNNTQYEFQVKANVPDYGAWTTWSSSVLATPGLSFAWATAKVQGQNFSLTATEWNDFTTRINDVRVGHSLSTVTFTNAVTGNSFTASMYNEAVNAINAMSPPVALPIITETSLITCSTGNNVKASYLNGIVSSLNSIV